MSSTGSVAEAYIFPNINIPSSKKDEDYHKKFTWAIINRSLNSSFDLDYRTLESCQDYYNGIQDQEAFGFLQEAADGDKLPAFWVNYNKIKSKIDLLVGEYTKKSYYINVSSVNKDAKIRKLEERENARIDFRLQPYVQGLESEFGIPLKHGAAFESEEEVDDFYDYSYKEKSEVVMKTALEYSLRRQKWDYEKKSLARDLFITGRMFSKSELIDGVPKTRRIDPKYMVWDRNATDDFLTDATYFGEVRYMNIADAAQKYDVTQEELKKSYNSQKQLHNTTNPSKYRQINNILADSSLSFFKEDRGELRVLILEAYWVDYEKLKNKVSEDKYGNYHVKTLSDDTKENKSIKSNNYKVWRKAVLIGGEFVKDWGIIKNMPRSIDDPADTGCPYKGCVVNYVNYSNTSVVSLIKPLQDLKNIALYNLQLSMARAGAKGFVYDTAQTPEGWDVHTVMKYLKQSGIAFINSRQDDGQPTQFNQFQPIDLSLGTEVRSYLEISQALDSEMDQITGVNEARQGLIQSASQAVGVTQSALLQSSLTTETYFDSLRTFCSDVYNYTAGLIKVSWPQYQDRFSYIIGDTGINFLNEDLDLDLDDYAVYVEELPPAVADLQNVQAFVNVAVQSKMLDFISGIKILKEKDIDKAIRMLEREMSIQERKQVQQQMQAEQAQMQQMQMQQQAAAQEKQQEFNKEVTLKQMDHEASKKEEVLKGKVDVILERIKKAHNDSKPPLSTGDNL